MTHDAQLVTALTGIETIFHSVSSVFSRAGAQARFQPNKKGWSGRLADGSRRLDPLTIMSAHEALEIKMFLQDAVAALNEHIPADLASMNRISVTVELYRWGGSRVFTYAKQHGVILDRLTTPRTLVAGLRVVADLLRKAPLLPPAGREKEPNFIVSVSDETKLRRPAMHSWPSWATDEQVALREGLIKEMCADALRGKTAGLPPNPDAYHVHHLSKGRLDLAEAKAQVAALLAP